MTTLSGKTTLVTGASRGMGRASALALAAAGTQVLVHCGCGVKEADGVVTEIRKARTVCGKAARTDLGGGREVTRVPTAKDAVLLQCMSPQLADFVAKVFLHS
jgi:NAD(P)-dependent dehydrogenase (short-subunit alcohol dehydrogenase family)